MINRDKVKQLVNNYFSEAEDEQIEQVVEELVREMEIFTHSKARELINGERMKKSV